VEEAADGSVLLERGDCVVMDNCGFHHGLFVEPVLRELLNDYGVQLIYQPPYCPHLNTCEYCFHQLKEFLRSCHILAMEETKIAISEGVSSISTTNSHNYFRNCGYYSPITLMLHVYKAAESSNKYLPPCS